MGINPLTDCVPQETAQLFWQLAQQLAAGELTYEQALALFEEGLSIARAV